MSDISQEQYEAAIKLLEAGGTKKAACELLGIKYNTTRLGKLLDTYSEDLAMDKRLRAKKRKEPVSKEELVTLIEDYLSGMSLDEISRTSYRSTALIKHHLEKHGAMLRHTSYDELNPPMLPEQCIYNSFEDGEYVWSAKYNSVARVICKFKNAYRIKVVNEHMNQYSYQAPEELGSLRHLIGLGVNVKGLMKGAMSSDEITVTINEAVRAANKRKK